MEIRFFFSAQILLVDQKKSQNKPNGFFIQTISFLLTKDSKFLLKKKMKNEKKIDWQKAEKTMLATKLCNFGIANAANVNWVLYAMSIFKYTNTQNVSGIKSEWSVVKKRNKAYQCTYHIHQAPSNYFSLCGDFRFRFVSIFASFSRTMQMNKFVCCVNKLHIDEPFIKKNMYCEEIYSH